MANFVTEDDKRIRDLQEQGSPLLSDYLAMDRPGLTSAMRISIQQVVNMAAASAPFIRAYAGSANPDNAFGANGDLFYTIPADGLSLKLYQKISNAWAVIFDLNLGGATWGSITGTLSDQTDLQAALDAKLTTPTPLIPGIVIGTTLSTNVIGLVGYSQTPMGDQLAMYNFGGQLSTAEPIDDTDAATKKYVDDRVPVALTFTQANLVFVEDGIYSLSFGLPAGKAIASITTTAGTVTKYIDVSQAVTDTSNTPNTIIEGFDNNSAQTITIKLI